MLKSKTSQKYQKYQNLQSSLPIVAIESAKLFEFSWIQTFFSPNVSPNWPEIWVNRPGPELTILAFSPEKSSFKKNGESSKAQETEVCSSGQFSSRAVVCLQEQYLRDFQQRAQE